MRRVNRSDLAEGRVGKNHPCRRPVRGSRGGERHRRRRRPGSPLVPAKPTGGRCSSAVVHRPPMSFAHLEYGMRAIGFRRNRAPASRTVRQVAIPFQSATRQRTASGFGDPGAHDVLHPDLITRDAVEDSLSDDRLRTRPCQREGQPECSEIATLGVEEIEEAARIV